MRPTIRLVKNILVEPIGRKEISDTVRSAGRRRWFVGAPRTFARCTF